jgi:hypothetical protein
MFKIIFVLFIHSYQGGLTTLQFPTLDECNKAKQEITELKGFKYPHLGESISMKCISQRIPLKRTKCKFANEFARSSGNYYPVSLECVEE